MFALLPILNSKDAKAQARIIEILETIAKQTLDNEPNNKSYYFSKSLDPSDLAIYGFEIYQAKSDLETTHFASDEFKTLASEGGDLVNGGFVLRNYDFVGGYISKPGTPETNDPLVWMANVTAKPGTRDALLEGLVKFANTYVKNEEKETLTYCVCKSLDDDVTITVFERYTGKPAYEAHMGSDGFKSLTADVGQHIADMKTGGYKYVLGHLEK